MSKVCDEPHPMLIKDMLDHCIKGDIDNAYLVSDESFKYIRFIF